MPEHDVEERPDAPAAEQDPALLRVRDLEWHIPIRRGLLQRRRGTIKAVDGVSFDLAPGTTLSLVGESGCGKSSTAKLLVGLERPTGGEIRLAGEDITHATTADRRRLARDIQIMFQDPYASLSPRMTVRDIVAEPLRVQGTYANGGAQKVREMLDAVGLPQRFANRYAHEFSGGQRQRIGIARALILDPSVVVLDEPVSALDVSIRAQVINMLERLQRDLGLTYLFISHDLSVVRHVSDRVAVMYLGAIVETGRKEQIFSAPAHPYTQALLSAIPSPELGARRERIVLRGDVPSPSDPPSGCRFRTRCWKAQDICATERPPLVPLQLGRREDVEAAAATGPADHLVACHFAEPVDILSA